MSSVRPEEDDAEERLRERERRYHSSGTQNLNERIAEGELGGFGVWRAWRMLVAGVSRDVSVIT